MLFISYLLQMLAICCNTDWLVVATHVRENSFHFSEGLEDKLFHVLAFFVDFLRKILHNT